MVMESSSSIKQVSMVIHRSRSAKPRQRPHCEQEFLLVLLGMYSTDSTVPVKHGGMLHDVLELQRVGNLSFILLIIEWD